MLHSILYREEAAQRPQVKIQWWVLSNCWVLPHNSIDFGDIGRKSLKHSLSGILYSIDDAMENIVLLYCECESNFVYFIFTLLSTFIKWQLINTGSWHNEVTFDWTFVSIDHTLWLMILSSDRKLWEFVTISTCWNGFEIKKK